MELPRVYFKLNEQYKFQDIHKTRKILHSHVFELDVLNCSQKCIELIPYYLDQCNKALDSGNYSEYAE